MAILEWPKVLLGCGVYHHTIRAQGRAKARYGGIPLKRRQPGRNSGHQVDEDCPAISRLNVAGQKENRISSSAAMNLSKLAIKTFRDGDINKAQAGYPRSPDR